MVDSKDVNCSGIWNILKTDPLNVFYQLKLLQAGGVVTSSSTITILIFVKKYITVTIVFYYPFSLTTINAFFISTCYLCFFLLWITYFFLVNLPVLSYFVINFTLIKLKKKYKANLCTIGDYNFKYLLYCPSPGYASYSIFSPCNRSNINLVCILPISFWFTLMYVCIRNYAAYILFVSTLKHV